MSALSDLITSGDVRAIARGISLVEDGGGDGTALVRALFAKAGRAFVVGVTGAPGVGKSTLVDNLISRWRQAGTSIGVLAVDPSSPFTGGAMLGDRVRMQSHAHDQGVFIRSMATRGHLGGLSRATSDAATVLDAAGKDVVIIETVGVGQDEVDVAGAADVSILVLVPGMGDDVQALKAGVMEVADIFVVNKSEREGADRTVADIDSLLSLHPYSDSDWRPAVVRAQATTGYGVDVLVETITLFRAQEARIAGRRRARAETQLRKILAEMVMRQVESHLADMEIGGIVDQIVARSLDPYTAAETILGGKP